MSAILGIFCCYLGPSLHIYLIPHSCKTIFLLFRLHFVAEKFIISPSMKQSLHMGDGSNLHMQMGIIKILLDLKILTIHLSTLPVSTVISVF